MTARRASPGPTESEENSCHHKTGPSVTAKVLINLKSKERSCFSIPAKPHIIAPTALFTPYPHPTLVLFYEGLAGLQDDLWNCTFGLNSSPLWAKIKNVYTQMAEGDCFSNRDIFPWILSSRQICREDNENVSAWRQRKTLYIQVTTGKGWALQRSSRRNGTFRWKKNHTEDSWACITFPHTRLPNTAWHV